MGAGVPAAAQPGQTVDPTKRRRPTHSVVYPGARYWNVHAETRLANADITLRTALAYVW